jgi:hypothetical protein
MSLLTTYRAKGVNETPSTTALAGDTRVGADGRETPTEEKVGVPACADLCC